MSAEAFEYVDSLLFPIKAAVDERGDPVTSITSLVWYDTHKMLIKSMAGGGHYYCAAIKAKLLLGAFYPMHDMHMRI